MTQSLSCPNCGASLDYQGSGRTMQCPYCGRTVDVPAEFWQPVEEAQTASQWKKYVFIFLAITVGLPTCAGLLATMLGMLGTLLGIGAGIFGVLTPFILHTIAR